MQGCRLSLNLPPCCPVNQSAFPLLALRGVICSKPQRVSPIEAYEGTYLPNGISYRFEYAKRRTASQQGKDIAHIVSANGRDTAQPDAKSWKNAGRAKQVF
jgi:hypothetical protein